MKERIGKWSVYGIMGKLGNHERTPNNLNLVHHKYYSADTEICIRIRKHDKPADTDLPR